MDRIDLQVPVQSVEYETISKNEVNKPTSKDLTEAIESAIKLQKSRFEADRFNSSMTSKEVDKFCKMTNSASEIIKKSFEKLNLTMRGYHKILKVARTIADLESAENIDSKHIQEALMYRTFIQSML